MAKAINPGDRVEVIGGKLDGLTDYHSRIKQIILFWGSSVVFRIYEDSFTRNYNIPGVAHLLIDKIEGVSLSFFGYYVMRHNHLLPFVHWSKIE